MIIAEVRSGRGAYSNGRLVAKEIIKCIPKIVEVNVWRGRFRKRILIQPEGSFCLIQRRFFLVLMDGFVVGVEMREAEFQDSVIEVDLLVPTEVSRSGRHFGIDFILEFPLKIEKKGTMVLRDFCCPGSSKLIKLEASFPFVVGTDDRERQVRPNSKIEHLHDL